MFQASIEVFKTVGTILFWVVVVALALLGLSIGRVFDFGSSSNGGAIFGFIVGGAIGFVVASWIFGAIHLLISINDHLAKLVSFHETPVRPPERGSAVSPVPSNRAPPSNATMRPLREALAATDTNEGLRQRLLFLPIGKSLEIDGRRISKRDGDGGSYFMTDGFSGSLEALLEFLALKSS